MAVGGVRGGRLSLPLSCLAVRPLAPMMHGAVTAPRPLQEVERFLGGAGYSESALRKIWATDRQLLLLTPSVTSSRCFTARLDSLALLYQTLPVLRASVQEVRSH